MWRKAWIEGNNAVIYCVPEELKRYHLRDLKEDLATSNTKYREHLQRIAVRKAQEVQKQAAQIQALNDALDDLGL